MRTLALSLLFCSALAPTDLVAAEPVAQGRMIYQLLATNKTSTLEKELNMAGREGFRVIDMMGGPTLAGNEMVAVMGKPTGEAEAPRFEYLVLATNKTSTMQRELTAAGRDGFAYQGQTVAQTTFGGQEVVLVLGREMDSPPQRYAYRLQATKRTKTMDREINEAAADGYELMRTTVSKTAFAGQELVSILMRVEPQGAQN